MAWQGPGSASASWGGGGRSLLGSCHRLCSGSPAPSLENAKASALGAQSPLFIDRPDFFDYSDSDQAKILALAQFIGEKPISFANAGMNQLKKGPPPHQGLGDESRVPISPFLSSRFQLQALPSHPGGCSDSGCLLPPFPVLHTHVRPALHPQPHPPQPPLGEVAFLL